ncbi:differentially expressed in FDCP 8 homolog [Uloborus diversus]|uniref:differentially expressed in FDCP 8 homolog n=1 Tax=Uloborus diversus TaxID=327109 RepID=UPI00240A5C5A|nr:differentially expressed in FDCP 8 homolog [Uloborus diversus]XP_054714159.1 differentially expressed in FDCP 8 homolog [Uloborus diversus]
MQKENYDPELKDVASLDFQSSKQNPNSFLKVSCCLPVDNFEEEDEYYKPVFYTPIEISEEIDTELGLTENYFSRPEGYFCFSTTEELEMAIKRCKEMITEAEDRSDRKKQLVAKLVQLRLKLEEIKDAPQEPQDLKIVLGHSFKLHWLERPQQYCEKCCGIIWGVFNNWYRCVECGFKCHNKCLNLITRICASTKLAEHCSYELFICPEVGLSYQKFRCAECKRKFIFKDSLCLPRLCDYNGMFYCSRCHWNSTSIIPARVIHNWDFTPRKVCRASLQFLRLMVKKPILNIEFLNPTLFAFVTELERIQKLREDILLMKKYFLTCHTALEQKLLLQLKDRQHFVENSNIYSLQDLIDVSSGFLLSYLEKVHSAFASHITQECQGCRGKGFICELCKSDDVIFPFEPRTDTCEACSSVFHQDCNLQWEGPCPKCARRAKVLSDTV